MDNFELVQVEAHGGDKDKGLECYGIGLYIITTVAIGGCCPTIVLPFSLSWKLLFLPRTSFYWLSHHNLGRSGLQSQRLQIP